MSAIEAAINLTAECFEEANSRAERAEALLRRLVDRWDEYGSNDDPTFLEDAIKALAAAARKLLEGER